MSLLFASIHIPLRFDLRVDLCAFAAALLVVLAFSLFTNLTANTENALMQLLTRAMNHRRWFTFWLIGFFIWAAVRSAIFGFIDWDTIILTGAWSFWPFAVENIVKVTQGKTLTKIEDLAHVIKGQNDETKLTLEIVKKALQANTTTLERVLEAFEDHLEGSEPAHE